MSRNIFPIPPAGTPILDEGGRQFATTWGRYLKALGDELLTANKVSSSGDLSWVANGNAIFCTWKASIAPATAVSIALPFPARLPFPGPDGSEVAVGASSVTVPAGITLTHWWYIAAWPAA